MKNETLEDKINDGNEIPYLCNKEELHKLFSSQSTQKISTV